MIALIITIDIKPEHKKAFMESTLDYARGGRRDEPGCLRSNVFQDRENPTRIYLYEAYKDQAALDAHLRAPHYLKWRETAKDWFAAEKNVRRVATPVYPPESAWRKG